MTKKNIYNIDPKKTVIIKPITTEKDIIDVCNTLKHTSHIRHQKGKRLLACIVIGKNAFELSRPKLLVLEYNFYKDPYTKEFLLGYLGEKSFLISRHSSEISEFVGIIKNTRDFSLVISKKKYSNTRLNTILQYITGKLLSYNDGQKK